MGPTRQSRLALREGSGSIFNCLFPKPLWLELYLGRSKQWGSFLCVGHTSLTSSLMRATYICDVWKVGWKFDKNESGNIAKGEIKNKVEKLLGDTNFRARASKLKEIAITKVKAGGQSNKNLKNFIEWINS
ncbi:hypothetical protein M0R45_033288 [Rubus argutus]|uniref:EF-hand domain-containing protein n=1 Tax=Rubus argutus TaxID=59490 RepID=A0AAW1WNL2_RUBAR